MLTEISFLELVKDAKIVGIETREVDRFDDKPEDSQLFIDRIKLSNGVVIQLHCTGFIDDDEVILSVPKYLQNKDS